jgi:hypothetical protein
MSRERPVRRADLWPDFLNNVGSSTSHNPIGLHELLRDIFTFYYFSWCFKTSNSIEVENRNMYIDLQST